MIQKIILVKGFANLTKREYTKFKKGDTIYGNDSEPKELQRWNETDENDALKELEKYHCVYDTRNSDGFTTIQEYALEWFDCDDDGEFISSSGYKFADEKIEIKYYIYDDFLEDTLFTQAFDTPDAAIRFMNEWQKDNDEVLSYRIADYYGNEVE
ncbi:MAG: hypothetical protein Q4F88_06870 [Eubacteriales bacterium]|nr:hypothetical protein [Eubacteriales bacterium]